MKPSKSLEAKILKGCFCPTIFYKSDIWVFSSDGSLSMTFLDVNFHLEEEGLVADKLIPSNVKYTNNTASIAIISVHDSTCSFYGSIGKNTKEEPIGKIKRIICNLLNLQGKKAEFYDIEIGKTLAIEDSVAYLHALEIKFS